MDTNINNTNTITNTPKPTMNPKALNTLEYHKILERLAAKAASPEGKRLCSLLVPMKSYRDIERAQKETTEASGLILQRGSLPLGGIRDIKASCERAEVGGVLSIDELIAVGDFLYVVRKVLSYSAKQPFPLLEERFELIKAVEELERAISRTFIGQEVADEASAELTSIRRNIKISNDRIREQLNSIIHSQNYKTMLQDAVITIRNDRYCVPVKYDSRSSFPGMVHDQSSSGATLFIEPMAVVQLNNRIRELHLEEKLEIERILQRLSAMVATHCEALNLDYQVLSELDFIFAKGELSLSMMANEPDFNTKGYINLKKARHPLLDKDKVVPTDIYLGADFDTLLITGPNTGGKTVSLKTLGLFTLMGQSGLHISAAEHSELAVFDEVFADIGDEQSIEQSLSTFSSHMTNIVRILSQVTDNSLVLLDELGAGTDPTEGAALAISILEYLHGRSIRTAVTTHYSELKIFALSTPGVENASCEFDVETLRPTYKLLIGIPGKSNAFAISRKLGLPEAIIDEAKEIISREDIRLEDVISDLEMNKKTAQLEKERAEQGRKEIDRLKAALEAEREKFKLQKEKILTAAKEEARELLYNAKETVDEMIKDLQKKGLEAANDVRQKAREKISTLETELSKHSEEKKILRPIPKVLRLGTAVYVHSLNQRANVITLPDANGELTVQAGIMKVKVHISNLSLDEQKDNPTPKVIRQGTSVKAGKSASISTELDLRGQLVDEALQATEKYLDDAYLSGLGKVTLIHGKGTGALRSAIHSNLKNHPHIKSYRLGQFGEGENGVTIVEFKE